MGKIVLTPGHSSDSISVLLDNGTAYVGDLAMNLKSMKRLGKMPIPIEAEDFDQVIHSMKKLIYLGGNLFYPSHGDVIAKTMIERVI